MDDTLFVILAVCASGRVALGLAPFVAVRLSTRVLGFPPQHDNPSPRLMARFFGVRDIGLGAVVFYSMAHPEVLAPVLFFNVAMDAGDIFSAAIPIVRRAGIDRGALTTGAFAFVGGSAWLLIWAVFV